MPRITAAARIRMKERVAAKENGGLVEALRLFGISNAEYAKAMRALTSAKVSTSTSTQPTVEEL